MRGTYIKRKDDFLVQDYCGAIFTVQGIGDINQLFLFRDLRPMHSGVTPSYQ